MMMPLSTKGAEAFRGLDRFEAKHGLLSRNLSVCRETLMYSALLNVNHGTYRAVSHTSGMFAIQSLADPAIKAVEDGEIEFVPKNWKTPTSPG